MEKELPNLRQIVSDYRFARTYPDRLPEFDSFLDTLLEKTAPKLEALEAPLRAAKQEATEQAEKQEREQKLAQERSTLLTKLSQNARSLPTAGVEMPTMLNELDRHLTALLKLLSDETLINQDIHDFAEYLEVQFEKAKVDDLLVHRRLEALKQKLS